jgi:peroxin-7
MTNKEIQDYPIQNWQEHQREVFSVDWNLVTKDVFSSGSWDHTVKIVSFVSKKKKERY